MQWLPHFRMAAIDGGAPSVIVDKALALECYGPLITLRLAADCETWVAHSVWRMLDEMQPLIDFESLLSGARPNASPEAPFGLSDRHRASVVWERARLMLSERRLFWLAENREQAHLPDWVRPETFARFEMLQAAAAAAACTNILGPIEDGDADGLIMAAALQERAMAVLTVAGTGPKEDAVPLVVKLFEGLGARCVALDGRVLDEVRAHWFRPLLQRAGLLEWVDMGELPLAFVRVLAPDLMYIETDGFEADYREHGHLKNWTRATSVVWGRVG